MATISNKWTPESVHCGLSSMMDSVGADGDSGADIIECIKKLKVGRPEITKHDCLPKPKPPPLTRKFTGSCFCPQRTMELAIPKALHLQETLKCYSHRLAPDRVVRLVRMMHEITAPRPQRRIMGKKKKKKRKRGKRMSKEEERRIWLKNQFDETAKLLLNYIKTKGRYTPNYKQLLVASQIMKQLKLKKKKNISKQTKREICKITQQLAVFFDVKCEPYKRTLRVESKSRTTIPEEEMKHVIFNLKDFDFDSEMGSEEESVVEEEGEGEGLFEGMYEGFGEFEEYEGISEGEIMRAFREQEEAALAAAEEGGEGGEGVGFGIGGEGLGEGGEGGEGEEGEGFGESMVGLEGEFEGEGELGASEEGISELQEGMGEWGMEEGMEGEMLVGPKFGITGAPSIEGIGEGYESEEEPMGIAGEEEEIMHPEGTASYVSWCLYLSWLNEFSKNIATYSGCLKRFRECATKFGFTKYNEAISFVLQNWSAYLKETSLVDRAMTEYFKEKPISRCEKCKDYSIYDMVEDHVVPEELLDAIETTKRWRKLLTEAEKYCNSIICEEEEEGEMEEVEESIAIMDVSGSSSSGFSVEEVDDGGKCKRK